MKKKLTPAKKRPKAGQPRALGLATGSAPKRMRWVSFDPARGYRQKRPPIYKNVLVLLAEDQTEGLPQGVAVGYRKNSGGDKSLPFFVVPGIGGTVIAWSDSLPDDFVAPARFPSQNTWVPSDEME